MENIDSVVRAIQLDLSPAFEERLRAALADKDREWLVDQIVRLTLDAHSLHDIDVRAERAAKLRIRADRLERVKSLAFDHEALAAFVADVGGITREQLQSRGFLSKDAPAKGTVQLGPDDRSAAGEELLVRTKDALYAMLFGDESCNTKLDRTQQELLTFALPRAKASALDFMRASTELSAAGTWQDPQSVSNDERADNVVLEVQFGDTADELVGRGVIAALTVINNLEVNEQVLYARMINVEDTTLIS